MKCFGFSFLIFIFSSSLLRAIEGDAQAITRESADLLYHLLVVLHHRGISLTDVCAELERRTGQSGHEEKAARRADHT